MMLHLCRFNQYFRTENFNILIPNFDFFMIIILRLADTQYIDVMCKPSEKQKSKITIRHNIEYEGVGPWQYFASNNYSLKKSPVCR